MGRPDLHQHRRQAGHVRRVLHAAATMDPTTRGGVMGGKASKTCFIYPPAWTGDGRYYWALNLNGRITARGWTYSRVAAERQAQEAWDADPSAETKRDPAGRLGSDHGEGEP